MSLGGLDINIWGVLLAGIASMVIGAIYYSDAVLGKAWKKLANIDIKQFQKEMPRVMPLVFLGALITAYVLGFVTCLYQAFYDVPWLTASMVTALLIWLVVATNIALHNVLDQRPRKLIYITLGNRLLTLLAMGLIVGWLHS